MRRRYDTMVAIPEGESGALKITHTEQPAGYEALLAYPRSILLGGQAAGRVRFPEPTRWHTLSEKDVGVWMTDMPVEQEQHYDCLAGAEGRVLVGGLGLGLALHILDRNKAVDEIVVVERSQDVINLVWEHTPQGKAHIENDCLHHWIEWHGEDEIAEHGEFDLAFYDIWQSDSERTFWDHVQPLREATASIGLAGEVVCWNEDVMGGQLSMSLHSRIVSFSRVLDNPQGDEMQNNQREALLAKTDSVYTEWTRPFFEQAVKYGVEDDHEKMLEAAGCYLSMLTMPGRATLWPMQAETFWGGE